MKSNRIEISKIYEEYPKLSEIPKEKFPQHIFIIPDGNRRYAKKHGKSELWGHQKGFKIALSLLRYFRPLPIRTITLWGFAHDNWKRDTKEINNLMKIFGLIMDRYTNELMKNNSRFVHIGRKDQIPSSLLKKFNQAEEITKNNTGQIVSLAIDFGGEDQSVRTALKVKELPKNFEINEETIWQLRDTGGLIRSADLIFRTSETRTSDVGWINGKHSIIYFLKDKLFPEITKADLVDAIYYYSQTKKNEGK
jgi:undecaprenyl diphosphate synthase